MQLRAERPVTGAAGEATIPAVSMHQVGLSFGVSPLERRLVLANITLDVREGEFLCIVGPSGSGKTTLLRLLAGLIRPTTGEVRFRGEAVSGPSRNAPSSSRIIRKRCCHGVMSSATLRLASKRRACVRRTRNPSSRRSSPRWASSTPRTNTQGNFRRNAAARANRPLSRSASEDPFDGRAVWRARRDDAPSASGRDFAPKR